MSKIYIKYENEGQVTLRHYMPFDAIDGIKNDAGELYTEETLLSLGGILVDSIPEPDREKVKTQDATLYVNLETKALYYVYTDRPLTEAQIQAQQIADLQIAIAAVMGGMM